MRIGIDARALIGQRAGISKFVLGILDVFGRQDWEHEFILYAHKPFAFDPPNPRWRACVYRGVPGTRGGAAWLQLYGRLLAKRDGIDVYWGPVFHLPILFAGQIPSVVTVHDLVHLFFPKTMELRNYVLMKLFLRPSLWCAHHVTADSEATARDLGRHMGVPSRKITVIYPAASREFQPRDPEQAHRRIREVFGVDDPYLLSVATLEPRKNLQTLIRAFAMLPESVRRRWPLVIAGGSGWKNSSLYEAAAPLVQEGTVRFLGYVADADLP